MRLVNYRCSECGHEIEELYRLSEEIPETLDRVCFECKKRVEMQLLNFKNNIHRVYIADSGGID